MFSAEKIQSQSTECAVQRIRRSPRDPHMTVRRCGSSADRASSSPRTQVDEILRRLRPVNAERRQNVRVQVDVPGMIVFRDVDRVCRREDRPAAPTDDSIVRAISRGTPRRHRRSRRSTTVPRGCRATTMFTSRREAHRSVSQQRRDRHLRPPVRATESARVTESCRAARRREIECEQRMREREDHLLAIAGPLPNSPRTS